MLAEPTVAAKQLSQALRSHELQLIDERGTWWLARGADIVHLSVARGGYAIESLDSGDPVSTSLASRFLFGRGVLG